MTITIDIILLVLSIGLAAYSLHAYPKVNFNGVANATVFLTLFLGVHVYQQRTAFNAMLFVLSVVSTVYVASQVPKK